MNRRADVPGSLFGRAGLDATGSGDLSQGFLGNQDFARIAQILSEAARSIDGQPEQVVGGGGQAITVVNAAGDMDIQSLVRDQVGRIERQIQGYTPAYRASRFVKSSQGVVGFELYDTASVALHNRLRRQLHAAHHGEVMDDPVSRGQTREARHIHHEYARRHAKLVPNFRLQCLTAVLIRFLGEAKQPILKGRAHSETARMPVLLNQSLHQVDSPMRTRP